MSLDPVTLLSELVAIPSVNPMGRQLTGPEFFEYRMTEYLEQLFRRLGLPYVRQPLEPLRDNIVARLDGEVPSHEGGRLIMFEAHQDTVPVDGMTIAPWNPVVRDNRLYGRGACDIKGGMSAMLCALARLVEERPPGLPTIIMACTINEEHGYSGAHDLAKLWETGEKSIIPRPPDGAIVAEPTDLQVVVAHKGALRWRIHTPGKASHSSQPHLGQNAIFRMARVLAALEAYQREVPITVNPHPLCGQASFSVGTISGGISVNTVPDRCTIEVDRRLLPGENNAAARQHAIDFIANYPGIDFPIEHEPPFMDGATLSDEVNGPLADRLVAVVREHIGPCEKIGVPYGTDASKIATHGVPAVVFGPGSIGQAHTCDEWLDLDELHKATEALYRFALTGG